MTTPAIYRSLLWYSLGGCGVLDEAIACWLDADGARRSSHYGWDERAGAILIDGEKCADVAAAVEDWIAGASIHSTRPRDSRRRADFASVACPECRVAVSLPADVIDHDIHRCVSCDLDMVARKDIGGLRLTHLAETLDERSHAA